MNILLVDDDSYVLEALQKSLDWETMGIENVYSAPSVNKAKKIIEDIPIQILVCDIEMPKENGFVLLKWLKQKNYIIKDILLTSYAEFKYANEAIKYGCYAYALKPIDFEELEKMIIGAIEEEKKALSLVNHDKYYEYWSASQKIRKEQYFWDLLINKQQADRMKYDFDYEEQQLFLPVVIGYSPGMDNSSNFYGRGMFEWTINNLITEVFTTDCFMVEAVLHLQREEFLAVIKLNHKEDRTELISNTSVVFLRKISKKLNINCSIIIGAETNLNGLQEDVSAFLSYLKKSLVEFGKVIKRNDYQIQVIEYKAPDYAMWESFLKNGQADAVKREVDKYLERQLACNHLDKDILRRLIMDFIQILIAILKESGFRTYQMGTPLFNSELINFSIQNVTNAKEGIHQMIDTVMNIMRRKDGDKSIIRTVKDYIDHNLDKEITREFLAEQVYLNQDYLARIFKKEIGESVGNYITSKRVEVAKEYLSKTNESVNTIAIRVGYDNFSYFTKIFKDRVGMTPKEYRRTYDIEEKNSSNLTTETK